MTWVMTQVALSTYKLGKEIQAGRPETEAYYCIGYCSIQDGAPWPAFCARSSGAREAVSQG